MTAFIASLNGVNLQLNENGLSVSGVETVDEARNWLARDRLASIRNDDDSIGFDVTNILGQRVRVNYISPATVVPKNNNSLVDQIHEVVLRRRISLSGVNMTKTELDGIYDAYLESQRYYAKKQQWLARISDPDISASKFTSLLNAQPTPAGDLSLASPIFNGTVRFSQGDSCKFSLYAYSIVTEYSFDLIADITL